MMNDIPDLSGKPHLELKCQVDTIMLGMLRDFVCTVAQRLEFNDQQVAEIEISVDEACANAMEHAYDADDTRSSDVQVELYLSSDRMTIKISDSGTGTPEMDHPMNMDTYLDINREKFRGLGLVLMRKFMDEVRIEATPGIGTTVEMTKIRL